MRKEFPDMRVLDIEYHFNWKFWKPKDCIGGPVRFGVWVKVRYLDEDRVEQETDQSWDQFCIKADMGLYRRT